ncbi:hypothetical protein BG53_09155, partial [Paenibacillus darwinianus]
MDTRNRGAVSSAVRWVLSAAVLMIILLYIPAPYVVLQPGVVESASPLVQSAAGRDEAADEGEWMVTTVYMSRQINLWTAVRAMWRSDREIYTTKSFLNGGTIGDYKVRMVVMMEDSQSQAIEAAYKQLGIGYELRPKALVVSRTAGDRSGFRPGDRIVGVNGEPAASAEELLALLQRGAGSASLRADVKRSGKAVKVAVDVPQEAADAPGGAAELLPALLGGVELTELRTVRPLDRAHAVTIAAG